MILKVLAIYFYFRSVLLVPCNTFFISFRSILKINSKKSFRTEDHPNSLTFYERDCKEPKGYVHEWKSLNNYYAVPYFLRVHSFQGVPPPTQKNQPLPTSSTPTQLQQRQSLAQRLPLVRILSMYQALTKIYIWQISERKLVKQIGI